MQNLANINSIITYNANLSPAQAQIKALTGQVAGLTTAFNALDKSALKAQRSVAATFAANVGQIGGFTAQTVKATSAVESFGKQLAANKLTMREYFREAITGYTRQSSLMRQLAEQQVRYQQSVAVPIGGGQAMMLTPQSLNAASSAAQLASARFSIFNELVNGGATSMLNWGKNTQWAGRQLMVGFTLPLALFAGAMSKQFRELDKELTRFQKVYGSDLGNSVSESTQRMRDQVQQLAYDISSAYGIAAKETAALAADIAATGAEGENLMASVQQTTRLAVLGEVDRQEAMKATLSLQSAFRMSTDELAESINFLNAVENQTSATLEDLSTAIPKVGPIVRSLGGDVKDLATLLVAMREGGIPAAEAANALKSGLASLINPTKQASAVAKQFGVDLVGIVEGNQGQLMPTIYAMQNALQGLDSFSRSRIIEQIFGKYQFARMTALFDNIGRVGSQTQSVIELASKSSAELAAVANGEIKTLTESTAVKFQRTLEQLKNSLMPVGQALTETLIPILEKVGEGIKMFSTFFSSLPDSVKGLAKWGVALTALAGPVIMLVGLFGNLVANGLKFGMMIVRLGARMAGIKTEKFQLLDENLMAAKLGVENLTSAFTTQEVAMRRLVGALAAYEQSLGRLAVRDPGLFVPGAVPRGRGVAPIKRQKGGPIPGYGGGDVVPAMLEPGEFVITKEATRSNRAFLETINSGKIPGMYRNGKDQAGGSGQGDISRAAKLHTVPPDELGKMYYGGNSKRMLGVLGYGGLTTTLHPQYINNTFDKLGGIPSWMKAGIPFNDKAAEDMLKKLKEERIARGGKVGPEFIKSIKYLEDLVSKPGKARSITLNGYAATTAAAERLAGIIPDTDKAQKARTQQLAAELNKRVGSTTSPGRIFSTINRLSMDYIDKALTDPVASKLIWESTPGASKTQFKDSLRERLPKFAQSGFLFRGIRLGRFQKGGVGTGEPALLEPGEFVVNSDASAQYAPILRAMNRGTIGKYEDGRDDVTMRPGYNPNDPKYSSPDKTPTGGQHQGHIFGAPVAPGIPAFGKNLQIGGQAIFWHQDFWKMVTAAENQLSNVLAMSAGNRARLMESLSIVGPQLNASQEQIDRIMLAATNGFMQHEDDVTLYQAALKNLGQRISTGAASVTGSMAGLIKQVESIKITGYSAAEAQAVERRLVAEYQRILSTPGQLAETARIAIAKQLQIVQQQMTATGIATTQMTASLASNIQASAARPFPGGDLVRKGATQGPQLAGAEQSLTRALQLRERLQLRLIASSERLEKLEAAEARIKADTSLSEQKRKVALDNLSKQYSEELSNKEILEDASNRAEQNLIKAKERAAASYATAQPGGTGGRSGGGNTTFLGMPAIPPRSGATGPDAAMKDPMARMMRGQGLMNVAFMGSMAVGSLGALGVASEEAASKLGMLSMALMALPMLQMMNPKGMATNFLGLGSLGGRLQAAGAAKQAAGAAAAPAFGTKWAGNTAANIASGGPKFIPSGMTAGSGLLTAGRALSFLGGPPGIALAMGITGVVTAYMLYKKAADEARERAIASFEDPAKSAEYFGETIDDLAAELENRAGRFKVGEIVDIDPELRKIVGEEYAPLIDRLKYSQAEDGARQLSLAYNNMLINGLSAENAQATLKAIAAEAGTQGGLAYSEAFSSSLLNAESTEEAIQKQLDLLNPENNKDLIERLQAQIPELESRALAAADADAASRWALLGKGLGQSLLGFDFDRQKSSFYDLFGQIEVGITGLGNVWTAVTGQMFNSTPEAQAAEAATNAVDQAKTSIEELKQLSADAFAASTEDFMKAYEDAPEKVIEAIRASSEWIDASSENVDILKQKLMELSPVLAGLIATLENPEEISLFYQLLTVGADPTRFFNEDGFNTGYAQQTVDTIAHYDELEKKNNETFTSMKEDTVEFIDNQIKETNKGIRKINDYWDSWAKVTRKEQRQAEEDYDKAQRRSEKFIDAKQDEIEAIEDIMDTRREEFDEKMQGLQDEKDMIEESTDKYIDSLTKRKEADSFYAQQRRTSFSALEKLASGDVFGFLQDREQMSENAQGFSYDQMISGIEERRDLEVDAIDETMEKERRRQEEWEKAQRDKIDGINDLIDAERDLMDERTKAHEKDLRQFEKRQKTIETNRKLDLKDERTKLADLTKAREKAESLELADYEEMSSLLGKEYEDRYGKQILELQKAQYYIRLNALLEQNLSQPVDKRRKEEELMVDAFTSAFGQKPGPAQGGSLAQGIVETLRDMGMFPYGPGQGGQPLASGGRVTGPGGPKSDLIPAMLSNGEYVVQASSVKKYGTDLMNTINAGKFAYGGYVSADRAAVTGERVNLRGNSPSVKYTYTPGSNNPVNVYSSPRNITGYPPNLTAYFDTNRRYQDKNTPDNNYQAKGKYAEMQYRPYAQDALDARTLPNSYSGGKKWQENMSRLTNLGLNSKEFFDQWRNLRRWEKEQFVRSLGNVSVTPNISIDSKGSPANAHDTDMTYSKGSPASAHATDISYNNNWWTNYESKAKAYVRSLPGGADKWMIEHFNDTDGHHSYRVIPRAADNRPWWQKMFIPAYDDGAGHQKGLYDDDGTRWPDKGDKGTAVDYGWANGGIVGFKNGSSNPTWYSADRAEQAATGTRRQTSTPSSGNNTTYYGSTTNATSPYTYTPGWSPTPYKLPAQRYGPYGVGRIPGTRKPYNIPEFGRTADLSAILASNYSHKLDAYAPTYQHLEYLRQKAGASAYVPGYGRVGDDGGKKWQTISSILSSPLAMGAKERLANSARGIPTQDYWRTLSREQKAWFLEYATTGNTNNWSNSRVFKLMPWLPKETRRVFERGLPGKLRIPMDRGAPTALNAYPNTVTIGQDGVAPTAPTIPGTNIPVPRPPGAPATSGYPMGWDVTTRVPMDRPAKPSGSNYIWDPQRYMWISTKNVGAGTSWGLPGTKDNAQSPIRFKPGMTPDTTRTSPQEQYPIGMSGLYLGQEDYPFSVGPRTSGGVGSILDKVLSSRGSITRAVELLTPEERSRLITELYLRSTGPQASLRSLNSEYGLSNNLGEMSLDKIVYNESLLRRFAEGGLVSLDENLLRQEGVSLDTAKNAVSYINNGGWPDNLTRLAFAIAMRESNGNPNAFSRYSPTNSDTGLFQVNEAAYGKQPWFDLNRLKDGSYNAGVAYKHVSQGGTHFLPWALTSGFDGTNGWDWSYYANSSVFAPGSQARNETIRRTKLFWDSFKGSSSGNETTDATNNNSNKTDNQDYVIPERGLLSRLSLVQRGEGGNTSGVPAPDGSYQPPVNTGNPDGVLAVAFAKQQLGEPYVADADGPDQWDCSGLTAAAYNVGVPDGYKKYSLISYSTSQAERLKINVRRTSGTPGDGSMPEIQDNFNIGDILYFTNTGLGSSGKHVSMYAGNGQIIEAGNPVQMNSLNDDWNKKYFNFGGSPIAKFASGGFISGPGGPRSDVIPAMLSNGEYVVKASSVSKYGKGFMDQLNSGQLNASGGGFIPKFANGGMVGGGGMPSFNMPEMANTSVGMTNNSYGGNTSSNNSKTNVKVVINGANSKGANAIANQVISMINSANSRRDHSRSI